MRRRNEQGGGPPSNPASGILPVTGAGVLPETLLALALLGVGTVMRATLRRRKSGSSAPGVTVRLMRVGQPRGASRSA